MKANDGQCLNLVSFSASNLECSCTDSPGQDASPLQAPSQQCWYSFTTEYTEANRDKINCLSFKSELGPVRDSSGARLCVNAAPNCQKAHSFLPRVP